jgi:cytochrome c-type biogenesis protein
MSTLFGDVALLLQHNPWLAIVAVFVGGITTALNPCVLAMIPLLMSVVAGNRETTTVKHSLVFSLFFVLGLAVTFTALGLISALLGRMFGDIGAFWKYIVAGVCLVMGLHLLGLFKWKLGFATGVRVQKRGLLGAFLLGLLFGVVSTPCAVPILAVLLTFVAEKGNIVYGGFLLCVYALGHSALILVAGTSVGAAKALLSFRRSPAS